MLFLLRLIRRMLNNPAKLLLILIFVFGATLRILGTYPGFNPYHPDEGKGGYASAWHMFNNKTLEPILYSYLSLTSYIQLITQVALLIPFMWFKFFLTNPEIVIKNLDNLNQFFPNQVIGKGDLLLMYWGRYITVFFSMLVMLFTYLSAKKLFTSKIIGLFALLVLATNFRTIMSSHLDLPDTYNSFFLIFSFWLTLRLKEEPTFKWYILAGLGVALAMSVKVQVFSLIPFFLTHIYISFKEKKTGFLKIKNLFSIKILAAILALFFALAVINFVEIANFTKFKETILLETQKYGFGSFKFNWPALYYIYQVLLTPLIFLSFVLGTIIKLKSNFFSIILILSIVIPFGFFFLYLTDGGFYTRNFVTITPFLCILAGVFLDWLYVKVTKKLLFIILIILIFFEPTKNSLIHTFYNMHPWSLTSTRVWLGGNLPENITIASHPWDKYILFSLPEIESLKKLTFITLDASTIYSQAEVRAQKADYALLGTDVIGDSTVWYMTGKDQFFWEKPNNISGNNFIILSAKEHFQNNVFYSIKPWQSPDNNYVLVKIPPEIKITNKKQVLSYQFTLDEVRSWIKIDGSSNKDVSYDSLEGHNKLGSIKIPKRLKSSYPFLRILSPLFPITPNTAYSLSGWIKTSGLLADKYRDGFFRIDFYDDIPEKWAIDSTSLQTNLSKRYSGKGNWLEENISTISPNNARYANISFQLSASYNLDFWISDIKLFTGSSEVKINSNNKNKIFQNYEDVIFPHLNGNL